MSLLSIKFFQCKCFFNGWLEVNAVNGKFENQVWIDQIGYEYWAFEVPD